MEPIALILVFRLKTDGVEDDATPEACTSAQDCNAQDRGEDIGAEGEPGGAEGTAQEIRLESMVAACHP